MNTNNSNISDFVSDYHDIIQIREQILDEYSIYRDEVELLVATPDIQEIATLENITSIEDNFGFRPDDYYFVTSDNLGDFVNAFISSDETIQKVIENQQNDIFPYNFIHVDIDSITESVIRNSDSYKILYDEYFIIKR
jgi:hypothetical protein